MGFQLRYKNGFIKGEWNLFRGGYFVLSVYGLKFYQRFFVKGFHYLGNEKEFIFRFELCLDDEPKISWFTLELVNPFEARLFFIWMKIWKQVSLRFLVNLGFRLTRASRETVGAMAIRKIRMMKGGNGNVANNGNDKFAERKVDNPGNKYPGEAGRNA